jgi:hypothetical protein
VPAIPRGPWCCLSAANLRSAKPGDPISPASKCSRRRRPDAACSLTALGVSPSCKLSKTVSDRHFRRDLWVPRPVREWKSLAGPPDSSARIWSGRRGSNPRHRPWQGRALPLSYSRSAYRIINNGTTLQQCRLDVGAGVPPASGTAPCIRRSTSGGMAAKLRRSSPRQHGREARAHIAPTSN